MGICREVCKAERTIRNQSAEDMTSAACKQGKSSPDPMDTKVWLWVVCFYAYLIRRWIGFGSPGNSLDLPARAF